MPLRTFITVVLCVTSAVYAGILFGLRERGAFMSGMGLVPFIGFGLIATVVSLFVLAGKGKDPEVRTTSLKALCIGISLSGLLGVTFIGGYLRQNDVLEAKAFCAQLVTSGVIKADSSGNFPKSLDGILKQTQLPRLLRGENFYRSSGTTFNIYIRWDFEYAWIYDSATGRWIFSS